MIHLFDAIPPNQQDLEYVEQGEAFPVEVDKVNAEKEIQFYAYSFAKMEEKTPKIWPKCASPTFGLKLAWDELYDSVYVQYVEKESSADHLFSSLLYK